MHDYAEADYDAAVAREPKDPTAKKKPTSKWNNDPAQLDNFEEEGKMKFERNRKSMLDGDALVDEMEQVRIELNDDIGKKELGATAWIGDLKDLVRSIKGIKLFTSAHVKPH